MTDRELLETAAKAAGYQLAEHYTQTGAFWSLTHTDTWSPLLSDADALRLMVDCELEVSCHDVYVDVSGYSGSAIQVEDYGTDKYAATRRVIVRAAAAMGSSNAEL